MKNLTFRAPILRLINLLISYLTKEYANAQINDKAITIDAFLMRNIKMIFRNIKRTMLIIIYFLF
jgi:hypothetical protein